MCVSVSPGVTVRFSDTVLYAAEVLDRSGQAVHVLGYQNNVQGQVGPLSLPRGWFARSGNAMILPFPAMPKTMTRANVLDTADCRDILQDVFPLRWIVASYSARVVRRCFMFPTLRYRARCDEVAAQGYTGFKLT